MPAETPDVIYVNEAEALLDTAETEIGTDSRLDGDTLYDPEASERDADDETQEPENDGDTAEEDEDDEQETGEEDTPRTENSADETDKATAKTQQQANAVAGLLSKAGIDYNSLITEYNANGGQLTQASADKLAKAGYPQEVVAAFIDGQSAIYDRYADSVRNYAGGDKAYARLTAWAEKNLSRAEKIEYNAAVESGNQAKAKMAIDAIRSRYENKEGKAPGLLKGVTSRSEPKTKPFTPKEMVQALDDPRYEIDPEYTRKVDRRLMASGNILY
ncbi:MAG: hypothetical protein RR091_10765 [Cloacibacillus sp.]